MMLFSSSSSSSTTLSVVLSVVSCALLGVPSLPTAVQGQLFGGSEGVMDMIPEEIKDVIPDACQGGEEAEFTQAIDCAVKKIVSCSGLLGVLGQFDTIIPTDASLVNNCEDIEASFCPIASKCSACEAEFDTLARCIVAFTKAGVIAPSIIDLVDSCALVCDDNGVEDIGFGSAVAVVPATPIGE